MTEPPDSRSEPRLLHGTCVAWPVPGAAPGGVLLRGPSGSGKSDLALRLLDRGWRLVSDDQCVLRRFGDSIRVTAPPTLAGKLEVRGLGILPAPTLAEATLHLLVDLVAPREVERLPESARESILGLALPCLALAPFEASAAIKLELAAGLGSGPIMPHPQETGP